MLLYLFAFLLVLNSLDGRGLRRDPDYCYSEDPNPLRKYVTKTTYDESRNRADPQYEGIEGCTTKGMWIVARHGTRYVGTSSIKEMADFLLPIQQSIVNGEYNHQLCPEDVEYLRTWQPIVPPETGEKMLAEVGWEELRLIGSNFKVRAPELLDQPYDSDLYYFRHSNYSGSLGERTRDSARAFCEGVWGTFEGIDLEEQKSPDYLIHFYRNCPRFQQEISEQPVEEAELFQAGPVVEATMRRVEQRLGLRAGFLDYEGLMNIWESCRWEWGTEEGQSPWCVAFTEEDLLVMEYSEDIEYYYKRAYAYQMSQEIACPLINDAYTYFTDVINGNTERRLLGAYGHSSTMNHLYSRLGFFRDDRNLTADRYPFADRLWKVTKNTPMSANVAFLLFDCGNDGFKTKTFVNEFPETLPGCDDHICDWETVSALWAPIADNCDMEQMCRL